MGRGATFAGIGVICTDTCEEPDPTVSLSTADKLKAKLVSPEYCAVRGWLPAAGHDMVNVAIPLFIGSVLALRVPLIGAPLSRKVTCPVGVPVAELVTVALI